MALNVVFIPSVSGGLGHVMRTVKLARALEQADPRLHISYVLSERRLRRFNLEVVHGTGYPVQMLPDPSRQHRDAVVRRILGEADVVIEDTCRHLLPYRAVLPRLRAWISIPMLPLWDELFMDWPLLEHADHILYTYPAVMPVPKELERFRDKLTVTGPILDQADLPPRAEARRRLGFASDERVIAYAPRGFPFGKRFGRWMLGGLIGAFLELRRAQPHLQLTLTAVPDVAAIQPRGYPPLDTLDGVTVKGVVPPEEARDHLVGADLVVLEGTSTLFDAAAARTPILMVPGPIYETRLEGEWVAAHDAGVVLRPWGPVNVPRWQRALATALEPEPAAARAARLHELVGTGGRERAVDTILSVIRERAVM